jgi:tRNA modification GTPase
LRLDTGDTIAAIATAPGAAGMAVIRLSGPDALAIADAVFHGRRPLAGAAGHTLHHGWARWPDGGADGTIASPGDEASPRHLDEVVAALFRAPRSYTREDVVELSCHGGELPARRVLAALLAAGARLARPGEFTLRAYLNGRLDLAQAEAVADLIHATTEKAHDLALAQLAGALSRRLGEIGEGLADALAEVEARVDFAEDVGGVEVPAHVVAAIAATDESLGALLAGAAYARALRDGVRVPLVGRPNVGKSSLFNALLGEERAIVTALPGTTRDRVSEAMVLEGMRVTLSDTAGSREALEPVEAIGVRVAHEAIEHGSVVLWVLDHSAALTADDRALAARLAGKAVLVALNKCDRPAAFGRAEVEGLLDGGAHRAVAVSALRGDGLPELRGALGELLGVGQPEGALGETVCNQRHAEALERARTALGRAAAAAHAALPGEIVALELRDALAALGEVTGHSVSEDLLDRIFSRFCVGK